jgi:hypothetical protein
LCRRRRSRRTRKRPHRHHRRRRVAVLRSAAGRDPHDRGTSDLVGELSTQSQEVRTGWAAHNIRFHLTDVKHFHHPVVGDISLNFNRLELAVDPGLTIFSYTAEPRSRDEQTLKAARQLGRNDRHPPSRQSDPIADLRERWRSGPRHSYERSPVLFQDRTLNRRGVQVALV